MANGRYGMRVLHDTLAAKPESETDCLDSVYGKSCLSWVRAAKT
jgi:hypothetical protein